MTRRGVALWTMFLMGGTAAAQQQSASYRIDESTVNAGGHPSDSGILLSANRWITLDAIGDGVVEPVMLSPHFGVSAGLVAAFGPPGEVADLEFTSKVTLGWSPEPSAGTYNLYRGTLSGLAGLVYGDCFAQKLTVPAATDGLPVPVADGYFYLVTVENRIAEEGTKGFRTGGIERTGTICP